MANPLILLLDVINDKHYCGFTLTQAAMHTGRLSLDFKARTAVIDDKNDTVGFSSDYTSDEFIRAAYARGVDVLCRDHGFIVFNEKV